MDNNIEYSKWTKIADEDLESAVFLTNKHPKPLEIICYHCQQCAEKYLKAFLILEGMKIPKTHDLNFLNKECSKKILNLKK